MRRAVTSDAICPRLGCNVDEDGIITAGDAHLVLRAAVGQSVDLACNFATSVVFWIVDPREMAALQLDVDYSAVRGSFTHPVSGVRCEKLLDGAVAAFSGCNEGPRNPARSPGRRPSSFCLTFIILSRSTDW